MKISICCPSYKRPEKIETARYLPGVRVYVSPEEFGEYREKNPKVEIIRCDQGVQGNVSRVRNFILKKEFGRGMDVVCIVDDDLKGIYYWEKKERIMVEGKSIKKMIEKYSRLAKEWGAYLWGVNLNQDKQVYREYTPFSTLSPILGPFGVFLRGNECRYDERLLLKEDYDMSIQNLNRYRIVLRVNKYFYECKQSEQTGGCAAQRNFKRELEQLRLLQKKWGMEIVRMDESSRSHNLKKKKVKEDYNPLIYVPIKGV